MAIASNTNNSPLTKAWRILLVVISFLASFTKAYETNHTSFWDRIDSAVFWIDQANEVSINSSTTTESLIETYPEIYYASTSDSSNLTAIVVDDSTRTCFVVFAGVEYESVEQYEEIDRKRKSWCDDTNPDRLESPLTMTTTFPDLTPRLSQTSGGLQVNAGYRCDYLEFAHDELFVSALSSCQQANEAVVFTGHALGGSAASLMAEALSSYADEWDMFLWTFGAPAIYDDNASGDLDSSTLLDTSRWIQFIATLRDDTTNRLLYDRGVYFSKMSTMLHPTELGGQFVAFPPSASGTHGLNLRFSENQIKPPTIAHTSFAAGTWDNYKSSLEAMTGTDAVVTWEGFEDGVGCFSYDMCESESRCHHNTCTSEQKLPCKLDEDCMGEPGLCTKGSCSECETGEYHPIRGITCGYINGSGCNGNGDCLSGRCESANDICKAKKPSGPEYYCNEDSDCIDKCEWNECSAGLNGHMCETNAYCLSDRCANDRRCADKLSNDEDCDTDNDCLSGRCDGGVCRGTKENGESCNENSDCISRRCEGQKDGSSIGSLWSDGKGKCEAKLENRRSCNEDSDCLGECRHGQCSSRTADGLWEKGSWCDSPPQCESGRCDSNTCWERLAFGKRCNEDSDCVSVICRADVCSEKDSSGDFLTGSGCHQARDCASGRCDQATVEGKSTHTCQATLGNGSTCSEDSDCDSDRCYRGTSPDTCRAMANKGKNDSCSNDWECKNGRDCKSGKCK